MASEQLALNDIRDRLRRARATEEPYDAADQWAALGAEVPALLEEVKRLRAELLAMADYAGEQANARRAAERVAAPAEAERDAALKVVHAAEAWRDARARIRDDEVAVPTWQLAREVNDAGDGLADAVDEWRASRGE